MKYLIDTNIPLLILVDQDSAREARSFFERIPIKDCVISDFSSFNRALKANARGYRNDTNFMTMDYLRHGNLKLIYPCETTKSQTYCI